MIKRFLLKNISQKLVFAMALLMSVMQGMSAAAQTPQYYFSVASPSNNAFPLNTTSSNRVQWFFTPSDFQSTPPGNVYITTIYVKQSNITSVTSATMTNFDLNMGNTTITSLSTGAWNTGLSSCISSTSYTVSVNGSNWTAFSLTNNFLYSGGNLILEMSCTNNAGFNLYHDYTNTGRRMYGSSTATTGTANTGQLLMGFDVIPANCSGTPSVHTFTTTPFSTANPLCSGSTTAISANNANPGVGMTYQWQVGSTSTGPWSNVTNGSGATTLNYTTGPVFADAYYRIAATCSFSSLTSNSAAFYVPVGSPQPSLMSGNLLFCPGDTATYSVIGVPGTTYTWTLPTGWTGSSTSSSILVTPGTSAGTISVIANSSCGTSIARTKSIGVGSAPGVPGTIFGSNNICASTAQTYSVVPIGGATSYIWTLPTGWSGTSNTNTINLTAGTAAGTLMVKTQNGCGQSTNNSLPISILTALAAPGAITGNAAPCSGDSIAYTINRVPGATSYVWSLPSGWSGSTTDTMIKTFPASGTGTLSVTAYVSCAISPATTKSITVTATVTPTVTVSTPASTLCKGVATTFTATATNGGSTPVYQWKKNGLNVLGLGNSYSTNTLNSGDVITVTLTSNAICRSVTTANSNAYTATIIPSTTPGLSINATPLNVYCKGVPLTFTTTRNGGGSAPTYQWYKNNVPISGATDTTYTDATLSNTDTLTILMTTNAICATIPVATSNKIGVDVRNVVVPSVSISVSPSDVIVAGQPTTFTATESNGGTSPGYQWIKNGVPVGGETSSTYTSTTLKAGDHISVEMLSYAPCPNPPLVVSNEIILKSALSVAGINGWDGSINIYPNPTNGKFTIAASWAAANSGKRVSIEVLNAIGQTVYQSQIVPTSAAWQADVKLSEGIANGRYLLRVSTDGMQATSQFLLSR